MPDENTLDTSIDTESTSTGVDTGTAGVETTGATEQQPASQDWRVDKYGPAWQDNIDYWRDTHKYLRDQTDKYRGELNKLKRQPYKGIEEQQQAARQEAAAQQAGPWDNVRTVEDLRKNVDSMFTEREFKSSMKAARERETGDPEHGIPSFAELEQEYIAPAINENPNISALLRTFPDPGKAAYTFGFVLKYPSFEQLRDFFSGKARQDMGDKINQVSREAVRVRGGSNGPTSKGPTPDQIRNMNPKQFAEYEKQQTGRAT